MALLRMACLVLVLLASMMFWLARVDQGALSAQLQSLRASQPLPIPLNGLLLDMHGTSPMQLAGTTSVRPAERAKRQLLFIVADSCGACTASIPTWRQLISGIGLTSSDEVLVASYDGTHIAAELAIDAMQTGARYRPLNIIERYTFQLATGITTTPMVVLLDEDSRVRFLAAHFDSRAVDLLTQEFRRLVSGRMARMQD